MNKCFICTLDIPVIISEDYYGILEPQEMIWKGKSGKGYHLKKLMAKHPQALLPFDGISGFSKDNPSYRDKTLFRFPLRIKASKLSDDVYNMEKLQKLLESLKEEAQYLLLFLRSVCTIEIFEITQGNITKPLFKVSVNESYYQSRMSQQSKLLSKVQSVFSGASPYNDCQVINDTSRFDIELVNDCDTSVHEWLVVNQIGSDDSKVLQLAAKQHVFPWVGVAIKLKASCQKSNGRIFCVLPLPVEDTAPFKVHVNGTFAVSSNRRSLQWEAQERQEDDDGTWNKLLVEKCLPSCYFRLITALMNLSSVPCNEVYDCWPDIQKVSNTPWIGLLEPFYKLLLYSSKVLHTQLDGGQWIPVRECVLLTDGISSAVKRSVLACQVKLVHVDNVCSQALQEYYTDDVIKLKPTFVKDKLKQLPSSYRHACRQDKFEILKYCLSDSAYDDLTGLQLIPLANGSFEEFQSNLLSKFYVSTSANPSHLLPGLDHKLVSMHNEDSTLQSLLLSIVNSNYTQLTILSDVQVSKLLQECDTSLWSHDQMESFWKWLSDKDLSCFESKLIVKIKSFVSGLTDIAPLDKQGAVVYLPRYSIATETLLIALEKCGIKFADSNEFSYLVHLQLSQFLYHFCPEDLLDAMQSITSFSNVKFTSEEALAVQNFFSNTSFNQDSQSVMCKLPIFKILQCSGLTRYSIIAAKTPFVPDNNAIAMRGSYDFQTTLIPNVPFVIDTVDNNANLLEKLSAFVCFMQEIEYIQKVALPQIKSNLFDSRNIVPFMKTILEKFNNFQYRQVHKELQMAIKELPFVEVSTFTLSNNDLLMTDSNVVDSPCNLYDPENELLREIFLGEYKFPASGFKQHLPVLKQCGLNLSVSANILLQVVSSIQINKYQSIASTNSVKFCRANAVLKYLSQNFDLLNNIASLHCTLQEALLQQGNQYCWLPVVSDPPSNYPSCLTWKGSQYHSSLVSSDFSPLILLSQDLVSSNLPIIVGSQAVFVENVPCQLAGALGSSKDLLVTAVVSHFKHIIRKRNEIAEDELRNLVIQTYSFLSDNISYCNADLLGDKWIWSENYTNFFNPTQVSVATNESFKTNLEPFILVLPLSLQRFSDLFVKCGVSRKVTPGQILSVLKSIKELANSDEVQPDEAWSVVKAILDWVAKDASRINEGTVLVPVDSNSSYPQLLPIEEVAYTDNELLRDIANAFDKNYNLIHHAVAYLSSNLGLTPLSDKLDISEDVFDDAGQHEPLITRLSNILKEYKDGLTIIKEMIQNADDAGATEVNILYDNRTHPTQNLLFKGMAESHGPALIVHNNSTFTNEDFDNITKLAGATKADQPLKIGKFGVGFCSVYHITDVPSFVSGEWLYIFDPTLKHLKGVVRNESRPGKRIQYQSALLANSQQLAPYQQLFGFSSSSAYNGTMFRLPFRTSHSQISKTIYDDSMIEKIKDDLMANGSELLLFLRNVKHITFSSIHNKEAVKVEVSIECLDNGDYIKTCVTKSGVDTCSVQYWLIVTQNEKLMASGKIQKGTASVACKLSIKEGSFRCEAVDGNAFCFLPLSVPYTGLPVHINANFAVMGNRSGIWTEASSNVASDSRDVWNRQLMTTIIPAAYCNLLKKLQEMCYSGELRDYDFHSLWPLTANLHTKYPWESLITTLLKLIASEKLFYSDAIKQWLVLSDSHFFCSSIFQQKGPTNSKLSLLNEAACVLHLPIVSLPESHLLELQKIVSSDHTIHIMNEKSFSENFLSKIQLFRHQSETRNKILFIILSAFGASEAKSSDANSSDSHHIRNYLEKVACIPSSPNGNELKLASQLVDPDGYNKMFDPNDGMFPAESFNQDPLVHEAMVRLGLLLAEDVTWEVIIKSARTVQMLHDINEAKSKALLRVKDIFDCIEHIAEPPSEELKNIPFIPVLPRPEKYFLPWKGDDTSFSPPSQVIYVDSRNLRKASMTVGSQSLIINTNSINNGGCDIIRQKVLDLLKIPSRPKFDDVHQHFVCLIDTFSSDGCKNDNIELIEEICRNVYEHFNNTIKAENEQSSFSVKSNDANSQQQKPLTESEKVLVTYHDKPFIWTGSIFVRPCDVSVDWKQPEGPYLYKLPGMLSQHKKVVECLGIKKSFTIDKLLGIFSQMYEDFSDDHRLPEEFHKITDNIISELNSASADELSNRTEKIILVNANHILQPAQELAFNDTPWLPDEEGNTYVISSLHPSQALALGVKLTSSNYLEKHVLSTEQKFSGVPFGQKEELTQRIRNILQGYPLDITFLKELLQNADDAQASKMRVILDKRQHGKKRVPSELWGEELQGPALLVWNDKNFSDKDLEGIQKLGLGSKRDNDESIGQFGIGFNVVYHLTDCPSFITRGNILCVFDPHWRYVPEATSECPGRRYNNLDEKFWNDMSELGSSFLRDIKLEGLDSGVLFRFPLRCTKKQVMNSELIYEKVKTKPLTVENMEAYLSDWIPQIKESLIFLNHVTQFEYHIIDVSGNLVCERSYGIHLTEENKKNRLSLKKSIADFRDTEKPHLVTYSLTLTENELSQKMEKKWLIQQGIGDVENPEKEWLFLEKTLPKHGIAATFERSHPFTGSVFCFLPLPVYTNLPVHINGQFALGNDRRSLWVSTLQDKPDDKTRWNNSLFEAISSSYAHFLKQARRYYFTTDGYSINELREAVCFYYSLFPFWNPSLKLHLKEKKEGEAENSFLRKSPSNSLQKDSPATNIPKTTKDLHIPTKHAAIKPAAPTFHFHLSKAAYKEDWNGIGRVVIKLLWTKNLPVLASKKKVCSQHAITWSVDWHVLKNTANLVKQAYFKSSKNYNLNEVLRKLGFIITCAPYELYEHLLLVLSPDNETNHKEEPHIITPESVFKHYCTFHSQIISKYPCPIQETPFKSVEHFSIFFNYLLKKCNGEFPLTPADVDDVPLLLTADCMLQKFSNASATIISEHSDLFVKNLSLFAHRSIITRVSQSYFASPENVLFDIINFILSCNYDPALCQSVVDNSDEKFITTETLQKLWYCLEGDKTFSHHRNEILYNWALIPSTSGTLYSTSSRIRPIIEPPADKYQDIFQFLCSIGTPVFKMIKETVIEESFDNTDEETVIEKHCINLDDADQILSVLYYLHEEQKVLNALKDPQKTTVLLFQYFVEVNFKSVRNKHSLSEIKSLPLFESIQDTFTSIEGREVFLCQANFCRAGYEKWVDSDYHVFLKPDGAWENLCDRSTLGCRNIEPEGIYMELIFPNFKSLTPTERNEHLEYIRQYFPEFGKSLKFSSALKDLHCLETKYGDLQKVAFFSDHTIPIFNTFSDEFNFLPQNYQDEEWLEFMRSLGLQTTVTYEKFKTCCRLVSQLKDSQIPVASDILVSYLFSKSTVEWHTNLQCMSEIGDISFVQVDPLDDYEWIKMPHMKKGLTKLNEAVMHENAALVWTIKPVVKLPTSYLNAYEYKVYMREVELCTENKLFYEIPLRNLGLTLQPEVEDVYTNLKNISETRLSNFNLFTVYEEQATKNSTSVTLDSVIKTSLKYLFEINAINVLERLKTLPCIPVPAIKLANSVNQQVLVKPQQVVRSMPSDCTKFFPYLHLLPQSIATIGHDLTLIGISDSVTLQTLQYLFQIIYQTLSGTKMNPNASITVREAILKLYQLCKENDEINSCELSPLYLPTSEGHLIRSTELVFIDFARYHSAEFTFAGSPYSLFELPDQLMTESKTESAVSEKEICSKLPNDVSPKGLSLICHEELLIRSVTTDHKLTQYFDNLKSLVTSLNEALQKVIVYHLKSRCSSDLAGAIDESTINHFVSTLTETFIAKADVIVINDLRCHLKIVKLNSSVAVVSVPFLFQKDADDVVIFIDSKTKINLLFRKQLADYLCLEVSRMHGVEYCSYSEFSNPICECLEAQSTEELDLILEKFELNVSLTLKGLPSKRNKKEIALGRDVLDDMAILLQMDPNHLFNAGDWVGYEIKEGHFVYAVVLCEIQDTNEPNRFRVECKIMLDESEDGIRDVSILDLYKFMNKRQHQDSEGKELVLSDMDSTAAEVRGIVNSLKLEELKRQILHELDMVWNIRDNEVKHRKAKKRMYLRYHPDKAELGEYDLFHEAFEFLKEKLSERSPLIFETCESTRSTVYDNNFEQWDKVAQKTSQKNKSSSKNSCEISSSDPTELYEVMLKMQPQKDPLEAERWLKQANSDFEAMNILYQLLPGPNVYCQVIFLAHEACEKALKAGMYKLFGLDSYWLKNHTLCIHAQAIANEKGGIWKELPQLISSSMEQYYLKSRYPNVHPPFKAPVDVYSPASTTSMTEKAARVLELIQKLF